jgi:hypothetical protein
MVLQESAVVKPLTPTERVDSDAWPEFRLKDVTVYGQTSGKAETLFNAHGGYHMVVEGVIQEVSGDLRARSERSADLSSLTLI